MGSSAIMVVFDFDKTIIDCDSDDLVVEEFGVTDLFNELFPTMPYNSLMDRMMEEIHSQGKTIQEIQDCLKRAPLHPRVITAIKSAYALGCDLRIVSDANLMFIEAILKHHDLIDCFSEINTNPSFVDEQGRLKISPYHDFTVSSHGCTQPCSLNMCKGLIIERMRISASAEGKKRFIYVGDGRGDYCPSLKLEEGDFVMPRKNYPAWDLICSKPLLMKAKIHEWSSGDELEKILFSIIDTIIKEANNNSSSVLTLSVDYMLQTTDHLVSAHHTPSMVQPLPVPHL